MHETPIPAPLMATAVRVFGSAERAEEWSASQPRGLDWQKPIDVLATSSGFVKVETIFGQIEYRVYT